jgi:putative SOS response-associated peptidase YedK
MPVIIAPEDYVTWLTGEVEDAAKLIRPAPDGSFVMEPTTIGRAPASKPPPKPPDQMKLF